MFLTFPNFNIYSTPLLVLVSQGILFGILLIGRYGKTKTLSSLFLALLVLITSYHRTTYTIGFMDWYDTYRNTKINYWLIHLILAIGPLIYFYVKSVTASNFRFKKRDFIHFAPALLYVIYRSVIFIYDAAQPNFADSQNGLLMTRFNASAIGFAIETFMVLQQLVYLLLSLRLYYTYRKKIKDYFSNTYNLELNWIQNFLLIYTFLFLYSIAQQIIDLLFVELSWIQKWWYQFLSALAIIYIGIKGYFTDTTRLKGLDFKMDENPSVKISKNKSTGQNTISLKKEELLKYLEEEKPYLIPDLNLNQLAKATAMSRAQLSETINEGFQKNFNDFINEYRIKAVKQMLSEGKNKQFSLLGIAFECGFNSKATFNRVFKRLTHTSPTEYVKTLS